MPILLKRQIINCTKNNNWQMRNPKADKYLMCCSFTNVTRSTSQKKNTAVGKLIKNPALFFLLLLPCLKVSYIC